MERAIGGGACKYFYFDSLMKPARFEKGVFYLRVRWYTRGYTPYVIKFR